MLDDLKYIHQRDAQDALGVAEKQPQQLEYNFPLNVVPKKFDNVVVAGMGGSALGALIAQSWPGFSIPFGISRDYQIPSYVSERTLFFASSYSGNTEETISAAEEALQKNAYIVVLASGGKLAEMAERHQWPIVLLPAGYQPRHTVLYSLKALLCVCDALGVTQGKADELSAQATYLREEVKAWLPNVSTPKNVAKQIAQEMMGKSIVVYSGPKLYPAAYKWKISFNENAKHIAWVNQFSEFNHNEFLGWTKQPVSKPYAVIELRSDLENERIQKRFTVSEKLLSGLWPPPTVIEAEGQNLLEQLLWTVALGDFVSIYVALLSNLNPTPVDLIERLKTELNA